MKVGIVVAVHNGEKYLSEAIESVLNQNYPSWSLVIIDDGSSDHSLELSRAFCKSDHAIEVVHQACCGVSTARNRGASILISMGCESLMFLDQDDALLPSALSDLVECLTHHSEAVAAVGSIQPINENGESISGSNWLDRSTAWHIEKYGEDSFRRVSVRELMYACSIATPGCCLVRANDYSRIEGFDATLKMCEDWDFWLRLSVIGSLCRISNTTLKYRYHENNTHKSYNSRKYAVARDYTRMRFLSRIRNMTSVSCEALEGFRASLLESVEFRKRQISESVKAGNLKGVTTGVIHYIGLTLRQTRLKAMR